jgi:hypothetical protein
VLCRSSYSVGVSIPGPSAGGLVVEELHVADRGGELDACGSAFAVEELNLHPPPKRLDHCIVIGAAMT